METVRFLYDNAEIIFGTGIFICLFLLCCLFVCGPEKS